MIDIRNDSIASNEEVASMNRYRIKYEWGHWVVYKDGRFWGSYDTKYEAQKEIEEEEGY